MAEGADSTKLFLVVMGLLAIIGGGWAVVTGRSAAQLEAASRGARGELSQLAVYSAELAQFQGREQIADQGAIRKFMMFRAGLADVDVRVRDFPEQMERRFTAILPGCTRQQVFRYVYNVRRQVPALRLVELQMSEVEGESAPPQDRWSWRLTFSSAIEEDGGD